MKSCECVRNGIITKCNDVSIGRVINEHYDNNVVNVILVKNKITFCRYKTKRSILEKIIFNLFNETI